MFCTACGLQMGDDAAFCSRCGKATGAPATPRVVSVRRLSRPMYDKKIAGVCSGFARYLDMDVTLMRVLWLIIAFTTGVGFIGYVIAWICMPREYAPAGITVVQPT
jgi:phage shock protein C